MSAHNIIALLVAYFMIGSTEQLAHLIGRKCNDSSECASPELYCSPKRGVCLCYAQFNRRFGTSDCAMKAARRREGERCEYPIQCYDLGDEYGCVDRICSKCEDGRKMAADRDRCSDVEKTNPTASVSKFRVTLVVSLAAFLILLMIVVFWFKNNNGSKICSRRRRSRNEIDDNETSVEFVNNGPRNQRPSIILHTRNDPPPTYEQVIRNIDA